MAPHRLALAAATAATAAARTRIRLPRASHSSRCGNGIVRALAAYSTSTPFLAVTTSSSSAAPSGGSIVPGVGKGKTSTGLVGLPVDHDAVPKMIVKYQALLDKMAASDMPPDAEYRKVVEAVCNFRIQAAKDNLDDPEAVERLCNCGQVEELVEQADDEMLVLDMYLRERWWEYVKEVPIQYDPDPEADSDGVEWDEPLENADKA